MNSQLVNALKLKMQPVAVVLTDDKPADGLHFKEGSRGGCVAAMMVAASKKGRFAFFDRKTALAGRIWPDFQSAVSEIKPSPAVRTYCNI